MPAKWLDSAPVRWLRLLGDLILVNLLCAFCCLPIVTWGASVSAMYAVLLERRREGITTVIRTFFRSFKNSFGQAVVLGLIALATAAVAAADILFALASEGVMQTIYMVIGMALALAALILFVLPLVQQAAYRNTVAQYLKNSFLLALAAPGKLILTWAAWLIPWALLAFFPEIFLVKFGFLYLMWGLSGPAFVTVRLMTQVFEKVNSSQAEQET